MATTSAGTATGSADNCGWSEERCLQLIKEYRARPILWNKSSPFYYNKQMRPDAWDEIGKILKMPPATCKHKMGVLMSSYRREKAKITASLKIKDKSRRYKSNWFAFKEMIFFTENKNENVNTTGDDVFMENLINVTSPELQKQISTLNKKKNAQIKKNKNKLVVVDQSSNSDVEFIDEPEDETMQLPILTPMMSVAAQAEPSQLPKLTPMISVSQFPTIAQMPPDSPPSLIRKTQVRQLASEGQDEINSFATFIAMKMKKFSQGTKNVVQKEICEIIFKADQGFYERSNEEGYNSGYTDARQFSLDHPNATNEIDIKTYFSDGE